MDQTLIHTETRDGFVIKFYTCPEFTPITEVLDIREFADEIDAVENGTLEYFCAKVTISFGAIELGSEYLGCCVYENAKDFINPDSVYDDMVHELLTHAHETVKTMYEHCKE